MAAATIGRAATAALLLRRGADVSAIDADGNTALTWAADGGRVQVVQLLADAGAIALAADRGAEAVKEAVLGGHLDAALLLVQRGAALPANLANNPLVSRLAEEARAAAEVRRGMQQLAVGAAGEVVRARAQRQAADAARAEAAAERAAAECAAAEERTALAAERDTLVAERDALAAEGEALAAARAPHGQLAAGGNRAAPKRQHDSGAKSQRAAGPQQRWWSGLVAWLLPRDGTQQQDAAPAAKRRRR